MMMNSANMSIINPKTAGMCYATHQNFGINQGGVNPLNGSSGMPQQLMTNGALASLMAKATLLQNRKDQSAGKIVKNPSGKELKGKPVPHHGSKSVDKPKAGGPQQFIMLEKEKGSSQNAKGTSQDIVKEKRLSQ